MDDIVYSFGGPVFLTLACNGCLDSNSYTDDQIWELTLTKNDPPALTFQTTYGLRAKIMRMYPIFIENEFEVSNPFYFSKPPAITRLFPNFLEIQFQPFDGIDVKMEYWVPNSQGCCGRIFFTNLTNQVRVLSIDWICHLVPQNGSRMVYKEYQLGKILIGKTSNLFPVVLMSGSIEKGLGSYPSLKQTFELPSISNYQINWAQAALPSEEESLELAISLISKKWEAELVRIELENSSKLNISTENLEWNMAFSLSQRLAHLSIINSRGNLPNASYVFARHPDYGFSITGNGTDYNHLWNGQTPITTYFLLKTLLPSHHELAEGLLLNYLSTQRENGFVDFRPSIGKNNSNLLATPILATLAWEIYLYRENIEFLKNIFDSLCKFFDYWLLHTNDFDGDGIPEWDHLLQLEFDDHPIFSSWGPDSKGVDIKTIENPGLISFLYQECISLKKISEVLNYFDQYDYFSTKAEVLSKSIDTFWDARKSMYLNRDRDSHITGKFVKLGSRKGPGNLKVHKKVKNPYRLLINVAHFGDKPSRPQVKVYGSILSQDTTKSHAQLEQFTWTLYNDCFTSPEVFSFIDNVEVSGLEKDDVVSFWAIGHDFFDLSLLLPVWAGIPGKNRASRIIQKILLNEHYFNKPKGIPICSYHICNQYAWENVQVPWMTFIIEGLLNYGYRLEAVDIFTKLVNTIVENLKRENTFRRSYHSLLGTGFGEKNSILGIIPIGLFLKIAGIQIYSPLRIFINGLNPFPFSINVNFKGTTIELNTNSTTIIFPDNQSTVITDPKPRLISHN